MKRVSKIARWIPVVVAIGAIGARHRVAQVQPVEAAASDKSYALPYLLVVLVLGLALMVVFRPCYRSAMARIKNEH